MIRQKNIFTIKPKICKHRFIKLFSSLSDPNFGVSEPLTEDIKYYAKKRQSDISLRTLLDTGQGKHLNLFDKIFKKTDGSLTDTQKVQIQVEKLQI